MIAIGNNIMAVFTLSDRMDTKLGRLKLPDKLGGIINFMKLQNADRLTNISCKEKSERM